MGQGVTIQIIDQLFDLKILGSKSTSTAYLFVKILREYKKVDPFEGVHRVKTHFDEAIFLKPILNF